MRVVTLLRQDFKQLLKKKEFREFFPEYKEYFTIKIGCCSFPEEIYRVFVNFVIEHKEKWKEFLKTDKIKLYYSPNGSRRGYEI